MMPLEGVVRMRFKVELHGSVVRYIRRCSREEQDAFARAVETVRGDPIGESDPNRDPTVSRYMLRSFRFAGNIALFQFDDVGETIRVRLCRKLGPPPNQRRRARKRKPGP